MKLSTLETAFILLALTDYQEGLGYRQKSDKVKADVDHLKDRIHKDGLSWGDPLKEASAKGGSKGGRAKSEAKTAAARATAKTRVYKSQAYIETWANRAANEPPGWWSEEKSKAAYKLNDFSWGRTTWFCFHKRVQEQIDKLRFGFEM